MSTYILYGDHLLVKMLGQPVEIAHWVYIRSARRAAVSEMLEQSVEQAY